jgi:hypothetical protein
VPAQRAIYFWHEDIAFSFFAPLYRTRTMDGVKAPLAAKCRRVRCPTPSGRRYDGWGQVLRELGTQTFYLPEIGAAPAFLYARRRDVVDLLRDQVELPNRFRVDGPLIVGSAVFGIGWGLSGICPGPGLLLLTGRSIQAIVFIAGADVSAPFVVF